jgi:hypothetical protein
VSPVEERTLDGIIYDSKAEKLQAIVLNMKREGGELAWWLRQVTVQLGPDFKTRIDFLAAEWYCACGSNDQNVATTVYGVEVKGFETAQFRQVRRLWPKYGPFPLHVVKRGSTVEVLPAATI